VGIALTIALTIPRRHLHEAIHCPHAFVNLLYCISTSPLGSFNVALHNSTSENVQPTAQRTIGNKLCHFCHSRDKQCLDPTQGHDSTHQFMEGGIGTSSAISKLYQLQEAAYEAEHLNSSSPLVYFPVVPVASFPTILSIRQSLRSQGNSRVFPNAM
jgi:hypothetical protein